MSRPITREDVVEAARFFFMAAQRVGGMRLNGEERAFFRDLLPDEDIGEGYAEERASRVPAAQIPAPTPPAKRDRVAHVQVEAVDDRLGSPVPGAAERPIRPAPQWLAAAREARSRERRERAQRSRRPRSPDP